MTDCTGPTERRSGAFDFDALEQRLKKEKIDTCLIARGQTPVFQYYKNKKMIEKQHKINSVSKSVLSMLVSIAIGRGELAGIDVPISVYFPKWGERLQGITLEHLLTMTPGFDWPEFGAWGGRPFPMINSKDWVRFVLERERVEPPGTQMYYSSGCSHLLSAIMQNATGKNLASYAAQHLFCPLGIEEFTWHADAKGIVIGGFGLSLKAQDMLKLGLLMKQNGVWKERQILPAGWVSASTAPRYLTYKQIGAYGYHWWMLTDENKTLQHPFTYFALGYGGQFIIVVPEEGWVATFTSQLYDQPLRPLQLFRQFLHS
ncbi:beta-lactamase family protein [Brevibacillus ruminantium]|uniref:Beta-lactamase family protein n=1 Tax=Brevibacillus ruminantium TaxID=2950604 RepID=A0ABY4WAY9_9BACL|nr:serine hydrolase [Brevibacillus ruminantium]USG64347.1 beta-lactamase family protein [Brevibacillus ruminantium]